VRGNQIGDEVWCAPLVIAADLTDRDVTSQEFLMDAFEGMQEIAHTGP